MYHFAAILGVFQFLLGRLETMGFYDVIKPLMRFQFLLGRLETLRGDTIRDRTHWFQFLLGRLETGSFPI